MSPRTRGTPIRGLRQSCALLVLLAWLSSSGYAQARDSSWATIRGTVYDSLLRSPLVGAHVWLLGSSRITETDGQGRYAFDSVPAGRQVISFSRPDLDSIGLSDFAKGITLLPGQAAIVPLVVPSRDAFWRAACGTARTRDRADSGLIFGTVRDAESRQRLAGAAVTLTWLTVAHEHSRTWVIDYQNRTETTDSLGSYYACGVPVEYLLTARARAGRHASGSAEVLVDIRGVVRRDLMLSREEVAEGGDSVGAPRRGLATLIGTARGERGGVLPGSYASLDGVDSAVMADDRGRFVLRNLPSGTQMLMVRRVGYFAARQVVDLRNRDTTRTDVAMTEATVLDTIRVTASPALQPVIEEIDERRQTGFGYLMTTSELRGRTSMRSVFQGFPSLEVRGGAYNFSLVVPKYSSIMTGGGCVPDVYIDGFPGDAEQLANMRPQELMAVEIYPRPNPALYKYMHLNTCAVVLVWTKWAR
jgi:hypothetical protein